MHPDRILKKYFGYDTFREHPLEVIQKIRAGKDAFVLMPTGIGKSICHQMRSLTPQQVAGNALAIAVRADQRDWRANSRAVRRCFSPGN